MIRCCSLIILIAATSACLTINEDFTGKHSCRTYVIYPPQHVDERVSDKIAHDWLQAARKTLRGGCDRIVGYDQGKDYFSLMNIDHQTPPLESFTDKALHFRLYVRLNATHLVLLTASDTKDAMQIMTAVYALSPYGEDALRGLPAKLSIDKRNSTEVSNNTVAHLATIKMLHLIPNSFGIGSTSGSVPVNGLKDRKIYSYSQTERSKLPPIISAIEISNIRHPYGYGPFDYSFEGFGSIILHNVDRRYVLTKIPPGGSFDPNTVPTDQRITYDLYSLSISPVYGRELAFYTPIGTLFVSLGAGPGITYTDDSINGTQIKASVDLALEFGYRIFYNDHIYIQFKESETSFFPAKARNDYFVYLDDMYASLTIGYYFTQVRSLARATL